MNLREAEDIKKRWSEQRELYKKGLNDPDNHNGMVTQPEPDILEQSVKSSEPQKALLRTKLEEVVEFQLSYFKS